MFSLLNQFPGHSLVFYDVENIPGIRNLGKTDYLDRSGRPGGFYSNALIIDHNPDLSDRRACDDNVSEM